MCVKFTYVIVEIVVSIQLIHLNVFSIVVCISDMHCSESIIRVTRLMLRLASCSLLQSLVGADFLLVDVVVQTHNLGILVVLCSYV